jgi:hypothetical protein
MIHLTVNTPGLGELRSCFYQRVIYQRHYIPSPGACIQPIPPDCGQRNSAAFACEHGTLPGFRHHRDNSQVDPVADLHPAFSKGVQRG